MASIPSFESSRTAIPQTIPVRKGKTFNDGDNVAKDSCENCFSNVLTITGSGRVNGNGLEVSRPRGQRFRQPKNQQLGPSTTIGPLPSYGSSTTEYFDDNVAAGGYEDYNDDAGYNYPVPSHPLPIQLPTPTTPAPVPTSPPSYNPSTSGMVASYKEKYITGNVIFLLSPYLLHYVTECCNDNKQKSKWSSSQAMKW